MICAPVRAPADDGTEWDAVRLHLDHVEDDHAYYVVVRYLWKDGVLHRDEPAIGETDDLILPRI
jgi:hypothetical protein